MDKNFSTCMFCREDILNAGNRQPAFSPSEWHKEYISRNRITEAVRALVKEFSDDFDVYEEYSVSRTLLGKRELIYKISIFGKGGDLGFLFQITVFNVEIDAELSEGLGLCRTLSQR